MRATLLPALALVCASLAVSTPSEAADCTAALRDLKAWTMEYKLSGGKAGLDRRLSLTKAAELSVGNYEGMVGSGSRVLSHASTQLMARIGEFFSVARKAPAAASDDIVDAMYRTLTVTSAGAKCELDVPDDIARLLADTMDTTLRQAFVGTWWESEWKPCHPMAVLTAEDYAAPIERLVFRDDWTFSVTSQGGGAQAFTRLNPHHVLIPDYSGRYEIQPAYSYIQLQFESGIHPPRDFSGNGHYRINGDELVLQNIWLGTYTAKNKPDICELTFKRAAAPRHADDRTHK